VNRLREYKINFGNLKLGKHRYDYIVEDDFFSEFEVSLVQKGKIHVCLILEKQTENLLILNFELEGSVMLECDRCLDEFSYPVNSAHRLIIKLEAREQESNDELVFLPADAYELDVSPFIYDYINLSIPMKRICEIVEKDCNPKMLSYLNNINKEEDKDKKIDPRWENLKNINKDLN
jgi:uncharacterized protein